MFIDNEGFDVVWNTIEVILKANTDSLILFPTSSVMRVAKSEHAQSSLDNFFGGKSWKDANDEEKSLEIYLQQLKKRFKELRGNEGYVSNVRVGSGQFFYDIILICKKGPYVRAWEYLKKRLNWKNPAIIETALDILKGRAKRIDWFLDLQGEVDSLKPRRKKYKETTLDNFRSSPESPLCL